MNSTLLKSAEQTELHNLCLLGGKLANCLIFGVNGPFSFQVTADVLIY